MDGSIAYVLNKKQIPNPITFGLYLLNFQVVKLGANGVETSVDSDEKTKAKELLQKPASRGIVLMFRMGLFLLFPKSFPWL